jgi:hypothetical protein
MMEGAFSPKSQYSPTRTYDATTQETTKENANASSRKLFTLQNIRQRTQDE